jgi:hypothetical protein
VNGVAGALLGSVGAVSAPPPPTPLFERHGDEFTTRWSEPPVVMTLTSVRESGEGLYAEIFIHYIEEEIHWARLNLASTSTREAVVRRLDAEAAGVPWRPMLERAIRATRDAARQGSPLVTLTGRVTSPTRELVPGLLYEGEPTALIADGDTGKSLFAVALSTACQAGVALPFGLKPARAVQAAYLDWETSQDTIETRLANVEVPGGSGGAAPPSRAARRRELVRCPQGRRRSRGRS